MLHFFKGWSWSRFLPSTMRSDLDYFLKACEWNENVGSGSGGVVRVEPGIGFCIII